MEERDVEMEVGIWGWDRDGHYVREGACA